MDEIDDFSDLTGRTIKKIENDGDRTLNILFSDGSFTSITAKNGWDGCNASLELSTPSLQAQVNLGVLNEREFLDQQKKEDQARQAWRRAKLIEDAKKFNVKPEELL